MVSSLIIAYFLNNFVAPDAQVPRVRTYREIRTSEHHASLDVEVIPAEGGSIPPGASRVEVLKFKMTADCDGQDVSIKTITLKREGMGNYRDIKKVYATHGTYRLTPGHTMSRRDGIVRLRFRSFTVPSCESRTVSVNADFRGSAQVSGEHRFVLLGQNSVAASASSIIVHPWSAESDNVKVEEKTIVEPKPRSEASPKARCREGRAYYPRVRSSNIASEECVNVTDPALRVSGEEVGLIEVTYLPWLRRITYGPRRTVLRFSIKADEKNDHRIRAITLTNEGTARNFDLHNLSLPGSRVVSYMSGNKVRIVFSPPLKLKKNQERLMTMKADIRASRRRTVKFVIKEPSDIESSVVKGRR
ncbi:MAG: hypothetical protein QF741_03625 [Candidatus Peribacteraceae bacterium]|jgi:hypothetical protein|nr:hypothetical protein [Candidatus Peribacteraceae bacterium]MDP7454317.1 hypothetical protein [Candidatus Peribacteraceae bacterium]